MTRPGLGGKKHQLSTGITLVWLQHSPKGKAVFLGKLNDSRVSKWDRKKTRDFVALEPSLLTVRENPGQKSHEAV